MYICVIDARIFLWFYFASFPFRFFHSFLKSSSVIGQSSPRCTVMRFTSPIYMRSALFVFITCFASVLFTSRSHLRVCRACPVLPGAQCSRTLHKQYGNNIQSNLDSLLIVMLLVVPVCQIFTPQCDDFVPLSKWRSRKMFCFVLVILRNHI